MALEVQVAVMNLKYAVFGTLKEPEICLFVGDFIKCLHGFRKILPHC
jgi:hypothetical protein